MYGVETPFTRCAMPTSQPLQASAIQHVSHDDAADDHAPDTNRDRAPAGDTDHPPTSGDDVIAPPMLNSEPPRRPAPLPPPDMPPFSIARRNSVPRARDHTSADEPAADVDSSSVEDVAHYVNAADLREENFADKLQDQDVVDVSGGEENFADGAQDQDFADVTQDEIFTDVNGGDENFADISQDFEEFDAEASDADPTVANPFDDEMPAGDTEHGVEPDAEPVDQVAADVCACRPASYVRCIYCSLRGPSLTFCRCITIHFPPSPPPLVKEFVIFLLCFFTFFLFQYHWSECICSDFFFNQTLLPQNRLNKRSHCFM